MGCCDERDKFADSSYKGQKSEALLKNGPT